MLTKNDAYLLLSLLIMLCGETRGNVWSTALGACVFFVALGRAKGA